MSSVVSSSSLKISRLGTVLSAVAVDVDVRSLSLLFTNINGYCTQLHLSLPVNPGKHVVADGEELHDSFIEMKVFKSFK